jgi:hypothetical protein
MIAVVMVGVAAQIAIEHSPDWTQGGPLRLLAFVALACGLASERPAVQSAVTITLLAVMVIGGTLVSVELM